MCPEPMFPRTECLILKGLSILAIDMARHGYSTEGYTTLVEGLGRVQTLGDASTPWCEELIGQYRRTLDEYACLYHVARE